MKVQFKVTKNNVTRLIKITVSAHYAEKSEETIAWDHTDQVLRASGFVVCFEGCCVKPTVEFDSLVSADADVCIEFNGRSISIDYASFASFLRRRGSDLGVSDNDDSDWDIWGDLNELVNFCC